MTVIWSWLAYYTIQTPELICALHVPKSIQKRLLAPNIFHIGTVHRNVQPKIWDKRSMKETTHGIDNIASEALWDC